MFAILCFAAFLDAIHLTPGGPTFRPAPIPERWLLKYAPKDMPPVPDRFYDAEWYHGFFPRSLRGGFTEWTKFGRDSLAGPPEVVVTHSGGGFDTDERTTRVRRVPLAVYGSLVEYDGNLYSVAITNHQTNAAEKPRWTLSFGSAAEVRKNVWYQAGSERLADGKVRVREYRLEFADDPRAKAAGKAKVFGSDRQADKFEGETTEEDAEFTVEERPGSGRRRVTMNLKGGRAVHHLLYDTYYPAIIEGVARTNPAVLTEAPSPAPKPPKPADTPGLMQPPVKPKK
jgi:hypothetical protein